MENINIKRRNFEDAKKKIQKFSNDLPTNLTMPPFKEEGGFLGWGEHKVTGAEMNEFVKTVQGTFLRSNNSIHSIYKEFKEVYNAFESLDKDYIQAILISIKSAEAASLQAKNAQKDVDRIIYGLTQTVDKLKSFKDGTSIDINRIHKDMESIKVFYNTSIDQFNSLQQFHSKMKHISHLGDIDNIWKDVQNHSTDLRNLHVQLSEHIDNVNKSTKEIVSNINTLQQYRTQLETYTHLDDIDSIWSDVQNHTLSLSDLNERLSKLTKETDNKLEKARCEIDLIEKRRTSDAVLLNRKLKVSYIIAGGAFLFTVIQLILNILGIL